MLTGTLEKLVLSGNATYNTFVVGGTEKHILNVPSNRFIIITGFTFQSAAKGIFLVGEEQVTEYIARANTQLRIFSAKSMNTYLFRETPQFNYVNNPELGYVGWFISPNGSQRYDTYLVHESDVSFTFSSAGNLDNKNVGITSALNIAYPIPIDYGKDGQPNNTSVRKSAQINLADSPSYVAMAGDVELKDPSNIGLNMPTELAFPVDKANKYEPLDLSFTYPILNVEYVEIYGNPTNISATL